MAVEDLDIVGEWPELDGKTLNRLVVQESWFEGELDDEANVVWLEVDGDCYRLYVDGEVVHWRSTSRLPRAGDTENPDFRIIDLGENHGLAGQAIASCEGNPLDSGVEIKLAFESGRTIAFVNRFDVTNVVLDDSPSA